METISFARGIPAPECLPVEDLAACAQAAIEADGATVLNYGPGGGYAPLRELIAVRHGVDPERVIITNGSLQGFLLLARRLAGRGPVLVEAPTYDRPLKLLESLGAEVFALPLDVDGIDVDALEIALRRGLKPSFLYTIPTFQNPSGRTLSKARRRRLVRLARRHDLLLVEDDPYGLVRFEGKALPTLFELDGGANVVYGSSFSKTVAPGLRVGYLVLPRGLAAEVEEEATGTYITPRCCRRRRRPNTCDEAVSSRTWRGRAACFGPAATGCSPPLAASCRTRTGQRPKAATSFGWISPRASPRPTLLRAPPRPV